MDVKPGYKQSEIGVIPADWKTIRLGELADIVRGSSPRPAGDPRYFDGTYIPWLTVASLTNISPNQLVVTDTAERLTELGAAHSRRIAKDTLVIANSGAKTLGVSKLLGIACCANDGIAALLNQHRGEKRFLCQYLNSQISRLRRVVAAGNDQLNLNTTRIGHIEVPFPEPSEQKAIADALGDIDSLVEALEQLVAKKRQLKLAAMQELLTAQKRLPGYSGQWRKMRIGDTANVKTGPFGSALHERDYVQDGTPIITVEHLNEAGVLHTDLPQVSNADRHRLAAYTLELHDIVFSRVGSVDKNALIRVPEVGWLFSGRLLRLRFDDNVVSPPYLSHYFHTESFKARVRSVAVGQTMASLNTRILSNVTIEFPPLNEQIAIAAILTDMDSEIAAIEAKLVKTRQVKQGMMQELLTGRIRLI